MTDTKTLVAPANTDLGHADEVIQSIYKQVFGNRHLMELDVNQSLEALFMNGDLTVQGFVTALVTHCILVIFLIIFQYFGDFLVSNPKLTRS